MMSSTRFALALLAAIPSVCWASESTIKDYLFDDTPGAISAASIGTLAGTAVHMVQAPKDLVVAVNALRDRDSKDGFGISFSPGRSALPAVSVPVAKYAAESGNRWARLWGGTSFSFAQNRKTLGGQEYEQSAAAVSLAYYFRDAEDPVVAGFRAVGGDDQTPCRTQAVALRREIQDFNQTLATKLQSKKEELGRPLTGAEQDAVERALEGEMVARSLAGDIEDLLIAVAKAAPAARSALDEKLSSLRACAQEASAAAKKKWNASQVNLVLGQGWLKGQASGEPRLSRGKQLLVAATWGPTENSLLNLTVRHIRGELETASIATTLSYRNTNIAALRYTYGQAGKDTFGMAEVSNVKKSGPTLASTLFRQAVGIDHKVGEGFWIEFRYGRARSADGDKLENKALFNLKFSPQSTLDKQTKP